MSATFHSTGPLSVGNAINAAVRLYKDHFKIYWPIALQAGLWALLPTVVDLILVNITPADFAAPLKLMTFPLQIFCTAKSLSITAVIARLAFKQLIYRPETPVEAKAPVVKKMWQFLLVQAIVFLLMFFTVLVLGVVASVAISLSANVPALVVILALVFLISLVLALTFLCARFIVPEVCLAVEEGLKGFGAVKRSWQLTRGFSWHVLAIVSVAFLITIPIYILASIPVWAAVVPLIAAGPMADTTNFETTKTAGFLSGILLFTILNILAVPFWQALKGVIYYDLRSRKEGLELTVDR